MAAEQAKPAIAAEGLGPPAGDAPCKGVGGTSRSEWRLGVFHLSATKARQLAGFFAHGL